MEELDDLSLFETVDDRLNNYGDTKLSSDRSGGISPIAVRNKLADIQSEAELCYECIDTDDMSLLNRINEISEIANSAIARLDKVYPNA